MRLAIIGVGGEVEYCTEQKRNLRQMVDGKEVEIEIKQCAPVHNQDNKQILHDALKESVRLAMLGESAPARAAKIAEAKAIELAFNNVGLEIKLLGVDEFGETAVIDLTREMLGTALGTKMAKELGLDEPLGDVLNAENVKRQLIKYACKLVIDQLNNELGLEVKADPSPRGICNALIAIARKKIDEEIQELAGPILKAVNLNVDLMRALAADARLVVEGLRRHQIKDFSTKGEGNRRRQARYRMRHKKIWVEK